jgi:hypothetical protein
VDREAYDDLLKAALKARDGRPIGAPLSGSLDCYRLIIEYPTFDDPSAR